MRSLQHGEGPARQREVPVLADAVQGHDAQGVRGGLRKKAPSSEGTVSDKKPLAKKRYCVHCQMRDIHHVNGQCLFAPTKFQEMTGEEYVKWRRTALYSVKTQQRLAKR